MNRPIIPPNPSVTRRFHDRNRWNSRFYSGLSLVHARAWDLLHDICDDAGVVEIDPRLITYHCHGAAFDFAEFLAVAGDRIRHLEGDFYWLADHIPTQIKDATLKAGCNPHAGAIRSVRRFALPVLVSGETRETGSQQLILPISEASPLSPQLEVPTPETAPVREPLTNGSPSIQDKNKDKDRVEIGVQGEEKGSPPAAGKPAKPAKGPRPAFIIRQDIARAKGEAAKARDKALYADGTTSKMDYDTGKLRHIFPAPVQLGLDRLYQHIAGLKAELIAAENAETEARLTDFAAAS